MLMMKNQNRKAYCTRCFDMSSPPKCNCWVRQKSEGINWDYVSRFAFAVIAAVFMSWAVGFVMGE